MEIHKHHNSQEINNPEINDECYELDKACFGRGGIEIDMDMMTPLNIAPIHIPKHETKD